MVGLEVAVQQVGGREQDELVEKLLLAELLELAHDLRARRWRLQEVRAHDVSEALQTDTEVEEPAGVVGAVTLDLTQRAVELLPEEQVAAVGEQDEVEDVGLVHLESVLFELELVYDLGPEQARDERARGPPRVRDQLLADARAADDVTGFQHDHLLAGAGQVVGRDEPVVTPSDDCHVVVHLGHLSSLAIWANASRAASRVAAMSVWECWEDRNHQPRGSTITPRSSISSEKRADRSESAAAVSA